MLKSLFGIITSDKRANQHSIKQFEWRAFLLFLSGLLSLLPLLPLFRISRMIGTVNLRNLIFQLSRHRAILSASYNVFLFRRICCRLNLNYIFEWFRRNMCYQFHHRRKVRSIRRYFENLNFFSRILIGSINFQRNISSEYFRFK